MSFEGISAGEYAYIDQKIEEEFEWTTMYVVH